MKRALTVPLAVAGLLAVLIVASSAGAARHPALSLVRRTPLEVRGIGFRPRETVRVSYGGARVGVRSSARGAFVASLPVTDQCSAGRVLAVGSGGDRALLRLAPVLCPPA